MGRVEALLDIKGNGISIDFRTERQAVGDFIKHNITGLYTGISESGYKIVNIRYSDISAPASPIEQEKLLLGRTGISHGKIDYRI
jgi:flagellar hook-length control protein FliK